MVYSIYRGLEFSPLRQRYSVYVWFKEQVGYVGTEGLCRSLVACVVEKMMFKIIFIQPQRIESGYPYNCREGGGEISYLPDCLCRGGDGVDQRQLRPLT